MHSPQGNSLYTNLTKIDYKSLMVKWWWYDMNEASQAIVWQTKAGVKGTDTLQRENKFSQKNLPFFFFKWRFLWWEKFAPEVFFETNSEA